VDILTSDTAYDSTKSVINILMAVEGLLYDPNPKSPYDGDLAKLFVADNNKYEEKIKEFAKLVA
jgi:ubiquitin-protein ligase